MKVFMRSSGAAQPDVVAFYPDDTEIEDNAHGTGVIVVTVPDEAIISVPVDPQMVGFNMHTYKLVKNWKDIAGKVKTWTKDQKISGLHELLTIVFQHGTDQSKWPPTLRARAAEIAERVKA